MNIHVLIIKNTLFHHQSEKLKSIFFENCNYKYKKDLKYY